MTSKELRSCACGCGGEIQPTSNRWVDQRYAVVVTREYSRPLARFLRGHHARLSSYKRKMRNYLAVDEWVIREQGQHFCQCPPCLQKGPCAETAIRVTPRHHYRGIPKRLPRHGLGLTRKEGTGQKISAGVKRAYAMDPTYRQRVAEASRRTMGNWHRKFHRRPTGPEVALTALLPPTIRYVGDGSFYCWIPSLGRNRNPDFKVSGQPKVVELFGDFWHRFDNPNDIIAQYAEAGLQCLVVWEREVTDDPLAVAERCSNFAITERLTA